jgi:excisionase family DNA binding protein
MIPTDEYQALVNKVDNIERLLSQVQTHETGLDGWISEKEAEQLLGIKYGALYKLRMSGELSFSKVGGKVFIQREEIIRLIEKNKVKSYKK